MFSTSDSSDCAPGTGSLHHTQPSAVLLLLPAACCWLLCTPLAHACALQHAKQVMGSRHLGRLGRLDTCNHHDRVVSRGRLLPCGLHTEKFAAGTRADARRGRAAGGRAARLIAARVDRAGLRRHGAQHAPDRVRDELAAGSDAVVLLARHLHHAAALALEELPRPAAAAHVGALRPRLLAAGAMQGLHALRLCATQPGALGCAASAGRRTTMHAARWLSATLREAAPHPPRASCSSRPLAGARREKVRGALHPLRLGRDAHALEHQVEPRPAARAAVRAKHGVRAQHIHLARIHARQAVIVIVMRRSAQAV